MGALKKLEDVFDDDSLKIDLFFVIKVLCFELDLDEAIRMDGETGQKEDIQRSYQQQRLTESQQKGDNHTGETYGSGHRDRG